MRNGGSKSPQGLQEGPKVESTCTTWLCGELAPVGVRWGADWGQHERENLCHHKVTRIAHLQRGDRGPGICSESHRPEAGELGQEQYPCSTHPASHVLETLVRLWECSEMGSILEQLPTEVTGPGPCSSCTHFK